MSTLLFQKAQFKSLVKFLKTFGSSLLFELKFYVKSFKRILILEDDI